MHSHRGRWEREKIFSENGGHLAKLIDKSKKYTPEDNFTGCLVWSIPFHKKIDKKKIKDYFYNKIKLDFDLHVFISNINGDEFNFFIPKKGDI